MDKQILLLASKIRRDYWVFEERRRRIIVQRNPDKFRQFESVLPSF